MPVSRRTRAEHDDLFVGLVFCPNDGFVRGFVVANIAPTTITVQTVWDPIQSTYMYMYMYCSESRGASFAP